MPSVLGAAALALLTAGPAAAAAGFERDQTPLPDGVAGTAGGSPATQAASGGSGIVRMVVGLAVVLAVIYGIYWLLKFQRKAKASGGDGRIEVVATTALGPNRAVHLLRVGNELVLVGSAEHGVTQLRVYDADETVELTPLIEGGTPLRALAPARTSPPGSARGSRLSLARVVEELRWRTLR